MLLRFKLGKQINKGHRCPNCKTFGLQIWHIPPTSGYVMPMQGYNEVAYNYYECKNCFAQYELIEIKIKDVYSQWRSKNA